MSFQQKLDAIIDHHNSLLCVGLDPDFAKLPDFLKNEPTPQFAFNKAIIDATHDLVAAYKPNSAFYEGAGAAGVEELKMTCDYIRRYYPDIPLILDAKRADIGNTNLGYAHYAFEYLGADAVTLHPYMGGEALKPFFEQKDKAVIILCRTSNPGAAEFQDLLVDGEPLYMKVAKQFAAQWNYNENCLLVVGATYPDEMKAIRAAVGDMTFLVPGVGAQGGDVEKTVRAGLNSRGMGMIINASRGVIFASDGEDFAAAARAAAQKLRDEINSYR